MNATFMGIGLSDREVSALGALDGLVLPTTGDHLARKMRDAGRDTTPAAAHQAGAGLARKGLARKGHVPGADLVCYEITSAGRDWFGQYRRMGGAL